MVGGSAKSDFILKETLTTHLIKRGGVKKEPKSSDVIYRWPPKGISTVLIFSLA